MEVFDADFLKRNVKFLTWYMHFLDFLGVMFKTKSLGFSEGLKKMGANNQLKPRHRAPLLEVWLVYHLQRKHWNVYKKCRFISSALNVQSLLG